MRVFTCAALLGCGAALSSAVHAQQPPAELTTFLQQRIGLDREQLASIERGDAIVKILDTENKRDVAVFGIIAVDVPRESYVARSQDFSSSLRCATERTRAAHSPMCLQCAVLSSWCPMCSCGAAAASRSRRCPHRSATL